MKNSLKYCLAALMLIGVFSGMYSCNKMDDIDKFDQFERPSRISVFDKQVNVDVQGTETYTIVTLNGNYTDWSFSSPDNWLGLSKGTTTESGKEELTIKISATPNTGYARTSTVTITMTDAGSDITRTFTVRQASALPEPSVTLSEGTLYFAAAPGNKEVTLTTNQSSWQATTSADWITLTQTGNQLKVEVTRNDGEAARDADVTVVAGTAPNTDTAVLKISQAKPDNEDNITINGIELIKVEGGDFNMGSQNTDPTAPNYGVATAGSGYNANQSPVHKVTLSTFYIGKFLVTQAQWIDIMGDNPSRNVGNNNPVEYVDWNMANDFLTKLSQRTGKTFRLATEAEWEYAARGGNKSGGFLYAGGNVAATVGNFVAATADRDNSRTTPGGTFLPNELGIYDMSGNLYEWCSDYFAAYSAADQVNPKGPATGTNRIIRGGSWWHLMTSVYYRGNNAPTYTGTHPNAGLTGFRVVYEP